MCIFVQDLEKTKQQNFVCCEPGTSDNSDGGDGDGPLLRQLNFLGLGIFAGWPAARQLPPDWTFEQVSRARFRCLWRCGRPWSSCSGFGVGAQVGSALEGRRVGQAAGSCQLATGWS